MAISDLVQLQLGWLNAWIPSFALVLIQFLYMLLYKEGGKRAVDTSWHTAKDKRKGEQETSCHKQRCANLKWNKKRD